jgi:hypothetical protein
MIVLANLHKFLARGTEEDLQLETIFLLAKFAEKQI